MDTLLPTQTVTFDKLWSWLQEHPNCILRCGSTEATLFDHEDFHWVLLEEEDRRRVLQLVKGKTLVGELVLAGREVREVTLGPDPEAAGEGHVLVELFGGPKEDPQPLYHVLMAHGLEEPLQHGGFKH